MKIIIRKKKLKQFGVECRLRGAIGSASDSRSEGCVFKSRRGHFLFDHQFFSYHKTIPLNALSFDSVYISMSFYFGLACTLKRSENRYGFHRKHIHFITLTCSEIQSQCARQRLPLKQSPISYK